MEKDVGHDGPPVAAGQPFAAQGEPREQLRPLHGLEKHLQAEDHHEDTGQHDGDRSLLKFAPEHVHPRKIADRGIEGN